MTKPGDRVKIITSNETFEGVLMPEEKEFIVLKMDTGYNIGLDKKKVKEISLIEHKKERTSEFAKEEFKEGLPKIVILHTGGTIASKVDYETGAVIPRFSPSELLDMFPELRSIANIDSRLIVNVLSENLRFGHYNILAKEIASEIKKGVDGIIITHGTDTLHYTSAALSFILQDVGVPVILVGAQRSSDRGSSDAALNLISAVFFIASTKKFSEVAICMHENTEDTSCLILPGLKSRKMHSSRRDAFKAINTIPWARVTISEKKVDFLRGGFRKRNSKVPEVREIKENIEVGILKSHPNMFADEILRFKGYDGLIIEGTGLGHIAVYEIDNLTKENAKIALAIKELVDSGVIVAMTTQTIYGEVNMNIYSAGKKIQELGVIGNYLDMTTSTAFVKLSWLLSNYPPHKAKEMFSQNLLGEISERLEK